LDKKATIFMDGIEVSCVVTPEYQPLVKNTPERMEALVKDEEVVFRDFVVTEARAAAVVAPVAPVVPVAKAVGGAGKPSTTTTATATATATAAAATAVALNSKTDFTGSWEDWATDS